jgi:hypothetical protein
MISLLAPMESAGKGVCSPFRGLCRGVGRAARGGVREVLTEKTGSIWKMSREKSKKLNIIIINRHRTPYSSFIICGLSKNYVPILSFCLWDIKARHPGILRGSQRLEYFIHIIKNKAFYHADMNVQNTPA